MAAVRTHQSRGLRARVVSFEELDQPRHVPQEFLRQLLTAKNSSRDGGPDCWLEMIVGVPLPNLARSTLMELMNQVVEIGSRDLTTLAAVEMRPKLEESL